MEQIKKRRNSILKKPPANEDDTTGDVTTKIKRRISFSGKKSVKEFIAGEEEATIWGTSYEESADCLQANSTESGKVNVNEKRIVLRNRRVIVDSNSSAGTKRRSKKKVQVAENDKENVFVQQRQVELQLEVKPSAEPVAKVESPVKSELALVKGDFEDVKTQTVSEETVDRLTMWSSTFDFINCSAPINKTITIEQSVDVTLNENELQMLKFRVPVTATDVSPNLSLSSLRDGTSPDIFSHSILMSEEDVNMLKMMRGKKITETDSKDNQSMRAIATENKNKNQTPNVQVEVEMDMEQTLIDTKQSEAAWHMNQPMSVSQCVAPVVKDSKRKTITKTVDMEAENTKNEGNLTLKGGYMNLVTSAGSEVENKKRTTMHMNQTMDVSRCDGAQIKNLKRKTITKAVNMNETSLRMDSAMKSHTHAKDSSSMDIISPMRKKPMHNAISKPMDITNVQSTSQGEPIRRQTIHFESAAVDESLIYNPAEVNHEVAMEDVPKSSRQTIHFENNRIKVDSIRPNIDISCPSVVVEETQINHDISMELSAHEPTDVGSTTLNPPCTATTMDEGYGLEFNKNTDIGEQKVPKGHQTIHYGEQGRLDFTVNTPKRRQSIHTCDDMIEDSPKTAKSTLVLHHQTIRTQADMIEDSPKAMKSIQTPKSNIPSRKTIYTSADIIEDAPIPIEHTVLVTNDSVKQRKSIYTSTNILEDSPIEKKSSAPNISLKHRQSVYTPADIIEDSPKAIKCTQLSDSNMRSRQTIYASSDIIEVAPVQLEFSAVKVSGKKRESIYTPVDIIDDSPKATRSTEVTKSKVPHRQTTYTPADIALDSPPASQFTISTLKNTIKQRQSIYTPSDMNDDSPEAQKPTQSPKSNALQRSIYTSSDIIEDSPKATKTTKVQSPKAELPPTQSLVPKIIVKHLNLQQGISGDHAALRILKNQRAKVTPTIETNTDESFMDMSVLDELSKSTNKMNFHQLNEEMFRGEAKAFAEEHKERMSLFDRLEKKPAEEMNFDLFMDKVSAARGVIQPARNSMKDYTMELSMRNNLDKQRGRESEYTIDLSFEKTVKPHETISFNQKSMEGSNESMNPLRGQVIFNPKAAEMDLSIEMQQKLPTNSKMEESRHQSIHIHKEIDLDESSNPQQEEVVSKIKRQTIHFNREIDFDETKAPPQEESTNPLQEEIVSKIKRQTIHFNREIDFDETKAPPQEESTNPLQEEVVSKIKRQTIHFDREIDFDESKAPPQEDSMHLPITTLLKPCSNGNTENKCQMDLSMLDSPAKKQTPHLNHNSAVARSKRQTIHFNQNNDLEESLLENRKTSSSIVTVAKVSNNDCTMDLSIQPDLNSGENKHGHPSAMRRTVLLNQNLEESHPELSLSRSLQLNAAQETEEKQTNEQGDDTMDLSTIVPHISSTQPKRQTIQVRHVMDLDKSAARSDVSKVQAINQPRRQTIHCNEDLELEDINSGNPSAPQSLKASKRQTLHFNYDLEVEDINKGQVLPPPTSRRQTIYLNQDLEVEDTSDHQVVSPQIFKTSKRQTLHFTQNLKVDDMNEKPVVPDLSNTSKRQSIHFNQDLEEEDINERQVLPLISKSSKRQTIHFNQDLDVSTHTFQASKQFDDENDQQKRLFNETKKNTAENALTASKSNRRTVHFQENNDVEESMVNRRPSVQASQDDSTMNLSIVQEPNLEEDLPKTLPMPRRLTILSDHPVDVEESSQKLTACKSSFSRTLNFNEIQTATSKSQTKVDMDISIQEQTTSKVSRHTALKDDDSPLYYFNAKSKSCETTSEIDRSLAEYLKAEAAATLFLNNSEDSSMEVCEDGRQCTDLEDEVVAEEQSRSGRQTSYGPVNIFEESGMQPLQKSSLRRQTTYDSEDMQPSRVVLQTIDKTHPETRQNSKQSSVETEPMMDESENFMETGMILEKPLKSSATRKTIHFTNENAVDESFFDDNQSKPAASQNQRNRQTIFFNECNSINDMEVTRNKGKSPAIQSLKAILHESNMLFTKSKLLTFENKRSTIYFVGKDKSMDMTTANESMECESPRGCMDPECTPTKSKLSKSRIPQLIDSAKKLLSMKKSMEFIQQELPNLGYSMQREDTAEEVKINSLEESVDTIETLRRTGTSIANVDIPRKLTTFEPKQLQESFDTVEIPRRVTTHIPRNLQESFDTIEIPRRATTFQKNETLYMCPNEMDTTNMSQKSLYKFEDAPITISDVSTFFTQKLIPTSGEPNETYSPNTTEALCNLDVNRFAKDDQLPKSSDSEDTTHNFDKFKKRYVELTCDSIVLSGLMEDIEKTHLSLVNTLDEQSEVVHSVCPQQPVAVIEAEPPKVATVVPPPMEPLKPVSSVCRKCKRHRLSVTQNDTTIGSFMFEPLPKYKMDLVALQELSTKPKISDVAKVWQQKLRESDSFNISDGSRSIASDDNELIDDFIAALNNERLVAAQQRQHKEIKREVSFVHTVWKKMQSKTCNWILNEVLLASGILKFTHTRIRTFAILISFTPKDARGVEVNFNDIQLMPNVLHTRQWTPFDYALHYQLLVELPFDLRKLCPTSENLFQLLEHVEDVTRDVLKTGRDMLYLVLTSPASLIRESSGSLYIRKYVRTKTPQNEVKRTEFQIEVRNIKKLSYESIAVPPLYEFDEKIQLLPVGHDFLKIFLADPMRYMKS